MRKIHYEKELNPSQLSAVKSTDGPHLVIAGAGSGKTRTLVYRVAFLVESGVRPDEILLLTFTRKAAAEMLRRASMLLDERCSRVSGGTFHSFANSVLRKYSGALGFPPNFSILDEADAEDTINLIRAQLGFNRTDKRFPRKSAIFEVISKSVNKSEDLGVVLYEEYPQFIEWEAEIRKIRQEYAKFKKEKALLDYDDLLVFLRDLLVKNEEARSRLCAKYRYIMVDEYQDTNKLQAHIACLLASAHRNLMVVGDDSQSIYSFRGANFKNIMDFPKIFKDARIITLEENYRSTQPILDLANAIIAEADEKYEKNLFTRKKGEILPFYVEARDEHAQSRYVADKMLELREKGVELKDIAVLFRSSWHSNDLEVELSSRNIPFVKYGGQKFAEAAHIKDVISYLRIAYNPHDEVSWYRALLLMRGIGPKTAQRLINELIHGVKAAAPDDGLLRKFSDLSKLLGILKDIDLNKHAPAEAIRAFLEYYMPLLQDKYDDFNKRVNDLDSLERIASRYDSAEQFLSDMALEPPERNIIEAGRRDGDDSALTLSTIHSAKGLEWHTVFVIYVADGHIPSYLSLENDDAIEEERRLLYVAATRAKENLFLLKPHIERSARSRMDDAGLIFTRESRFLDSKVISGGFLKMESAGAGCGYGAWQEDDYIRKAGADPEFFREMNDYFDADPDKEF